MAINKTLRFSIQFSRFAEEFNIPPYELAQMITAANAGVKAYERDDMTAYKRHTDRVEELAKSLAYEVDWPGLWPCLQKIGDPRSNRILPSHD